MSPPSDPRSAAARQGEGTDKLVEVARRALHENSPFGYDDWQEPGPRDLDHMVPDATLRAMVKAVLDAARQGEGTPMTDAVREATQLLREKAALLRSWTGEVPTIVKNGWILEAERHEAAAAALERLTEALAELARGDGTYYVAEERAFAPGIVKDWPAVIPHPKSKHGRLVRRTWPRRSPDRPAPG